jgi:hypothetical protein
LVACVESKLADTPNPFVKGVKRHQELTPWRHPELTPGC